MNPVAEEMLLCHFEGLSNPVAEDYLMHYGIKRRSGRYPYGSGDDPYQHGRDFLGRVEEMRKRGITYTDPKTGRTYTGDTAIAKKLGLSTTQFRVELSYANEERRKLNVATAKRLRDKEGMTPTEIGKQMGVNESTVRSWFNENAEVRMNRAQATADILRERSKEVGMIDVGKGAELELNVSREKLNQALYMLEKEGYQVKGGRMAQPTNPGQFTTQLVLLPPGKEHKDIYNFDEVHTIKDYITRDGGETFEKKFNYPASMDSKRLQIRYAEEGGLERDGLVELRRNVDDLSLGNSRFSQVRILVDGTHYIKGMAVYSDDMPDGVDVIFNTNKKQGTPMNKVLKEIKADPDNPFGSAIKDADQGGQYWYTDKKTGEKKLGLINKRADEGDWSDWKDTLPSQFLGKQNINMIKKQLGIAKTDRYAEFEEICALENPTVKKHLLDKFASSCDSAAVHLKAAALPGQKYHVIIPINSLKDNEVYAPRYDDGTELALIRYPHGGTFEIPILKVNNKNRDAIAFLGKNATDGIGINSKNAERLSGADFDGDTVMCIPTNDPKGKVRISNRDPLEDLKGFDPKDEYGPHTYEGRDVKLMTKKGTQTQMGIISNLITDMTILGADEKELARAVKHSMVVIDAEKHKLDYKKSELDNNIAALHEKYQGKTTGGASTILSRAKGETSVLKRQGTPHINIKGTKDYDPDRPEGALLYRTADDVELYRPKRTKDKTTGIVTYTTTTGEKIKYDPSDAEAAAKYKPVKRINKSTGEVTYTDSTGKITYQLEPRTQKSTKMAETDDAYSLVSTARHPVEMAYAEYANSMKALGNKARLEMVSTGKIERDKEAAKTYAEEVASLDTKLRNAELNTVRERAATRMANAEIKAKKQAGQLDKSDEKKAAQRAMTKYRAEVGSVARRDRNIEITDREWEAIQKGAISESKLKRILNNTDIDKIRERATPRTTSALSSSQISRIKAMSSSYTLAQIADKLNIPVSTVAKYAKE